jgi:hypothetical protein
MAKIFRQSVSIYTLPLEGEGRVRVKRGPIKGPWAAKL